MFDGVYLIITNKILTHACVLSNCSNIEPIALGRGVESIVPCHTRTGSNESDMSDLCEPQPSSMCLSPETNVEPYEDESQRKDAIEKRE